MVFAAEPGKVLEFSSCLEQPSSFYFGYRISDNFIATLKGLSFDKLFLFTEHNILQLHGHEFFEMLKQNFSQTRLKILPAGEAGKNFTMLEKICEDLIEAGVSKKSILIAFGGGAVGNLVGLAAGLIFRGIRFIEVPTTMTGQTDSTLSNKQAINGKKGKNHFGLYIAPVFIHADTYYLETEPKVSTQCGLIEGIKNGFINDAGFLDYMYKALSCGSDLPGAEKHNLAYAVIQSKLAILKQDPTEKHFAIVLEYGHTFGHAIEWLMQGRMSHGEAVSFGMKMAAELSCSLGLLTEDAVKLHYDIIENKLGFNNPLPPEINPVQLLDTMVKDNKKTGNDLRFVLLENIGKCYNPEGDYLVSVELALVRQVLNQVIQAWRNKL